MANSQKWANLRGRKLTVLLDSWCWIEYANGTEAGKKVAEYIDSEMQLFISVINLAEVYKKYLSETNEKYADQIVNF